MRVYNERTGRLEPVVRVNKRIPTPEEQLRVRELASIGLSDDDIASQLRLRVPKLQKLFKFELKDGAAQGREQALRQLHSIAISGKNLSALTFWVKARCGWRDTGPTQSAAQVIRHTMIFRQQTTQPHDKHSK